jgi:hypothetical protein
MNATTLLKVAVAVAVVVGLSGCGINLSPECKFICF